jgi:hypothetical protein
VIDRTQARQIARQVLPKLAGAAVAIGTDTVAETAAVALVIWRLTRRVRTLERDLNTLTERVDQLDGGRP